MDISVPPANSAASDTSGPAKGCCPAPDAGAAEAIVGTSEIADVGVAEATVGTIDLADAGNESDEDVSAAPPA